MEKSLDFSWPSSSAHPNNMDTIKLKNKSLKTVIAIICIILLFLAASIFAYFDKENIKLRFQIIHSETVERFNANKLIACDFEKNHTKGIEEELLKKIENLNESQKNEKELSNKLQFEINNIQIQLNKERLNSTKYKNESSYLKKDNEELHSKIEKLERLSASRTMKTEKPNTVPFNCNENDIIKNLENENQKLKDDVNNLNKRYEEKFYAGANEAASISELDSNNDVKSSWISNLVGHAFTSNADQNNINHILIVTSTIMIVLLQNSTICTLKIVESAHCIARKDDNASDPICQDQEQLS